jgi:hypothetical protein
MRRTHHTIMLVCEGYAEDRFARVIHDLYLPRNCGSTLQRKNARGYGGARALELALQLQQQTAHDTYGILVDTDRHWSDVERELARCSRIVVVENEPCLEATLLQVDGQRPHRLTRDNKTAFNDLYGGPADREGIIRRNFPRDKFDQARSRVPAIDSFLNLIGC